jgi:outer membrane lipoprotein LolB
VNRIASLASRRAFGAWAFAAALVLAGCATPPRTEKPAGQANLWSGRLALQVEGNQSQSFAAGFELKGDANIGELTLSNPLGGIMAAMTWSPGSATLRSNGKTQQFDSVDALVAGATGSPIPVAALFDWLQGKNTSVAGWEANLSLLPQGRISARRTQPEPAADLRIALER